MLISYESILPGKKSKKKKNKIRGRHFLVKKAKMTMMKMMRTLHLLSGTNLPKARQELYLVKSLIQVQALKINFTPKILQCFQQSNPKARLIHHSSHEKAKILQNKLKARLIHHSHET